MSSCVFSFVASYFQVLFIFSPKNSYPSYPPIETEGKKEREGGERDRERERGESELWLNSCKRCIAVFACLRMQKFRINII